MGRSPRTRWSTIAGAPSDEDVRDALLNEAVIVGGDLALHQPGSIDLAVQGDLLRVELDDVAGVMSQSVLGMVVGWLSFSAWNQWVEEHSHKRRRIDLPGTDRRNATLSSHVVSFGQSNGDSSLWVAGRGVRLSYWSGSATDALIGDVQQALCDVFNDGPGLIGLPSPLEPVSGELQWTIAPSPT
jgi:hypothetical protein